MSVTAQPILDCKARLGEGALWHAPSKTLFWIDILDTRVHRYDPATGENVTHDVGEQVGTVVVRESGGCLLGLVHGFGQFDPETGKVEYLVRVEHERDDVRFNDGKCDPAGRFWCGTMADNPWDAPDAGSLYVLDTDLSVRKMFGGVGCSNGIVWSADRKTMYYIDTLLKEVSAFDYDLESGSIDNRRTAVKIDDKEHGFPDGMAIDSEDGLWVAMWGGGRVCHCDPKKGEVVDIVEVPEAKNTTSCAFGGDNLDELYITTACAGFTDADWKEQPRGGSLFLAKPGVTGVPSFEFDG
jgi:sugar lactone lactonase YvrE